ncbi:uncharacterized protein [Ptychodera flava]|uniref:uncharacterized protein n=1 Tax=Ptychodera flava TaxID=63121 RepID=UPI003969FA3F
MTCNLNINEYSLYIPCTKPVHHLSCLASTRVDVVFWLHLSSGVSVSLLARNMADKGSTIEGSGNIPNMPAGQHDVVPSQQTPSSQALMEMVTGLAQSVQRLTENQARWLAATGSDDRSGEANEVHRDGIHVDNVEAGPSNAHEVCPLLSDRTCSHGPYVASQSLEDSCAQDNSSIMHGIVPDVKDSSDGMSQSGRRSTKRKCKKSSDRKGKKKSRKPKSSSVSSEEFSSSDESDCGFDNPHDKNTGIQFSKSVRAWFKQQRTNILLAEDKKELKERYEVCKSHENFFEAPVLPEHLAIHWEKQAFTKPLVLQDQRIRKASEQLLFSQLPLLQILQEAHNGAPIDPKLLPIIQHSITLFGSAFHGLQVARQKAFDSVLPNKYASLRKVEPSMATLFGEEPLKEAKKAKQAHNVVVDMTRGQGSLGTTGKQSHRRFSSYGKSRYGQSGYKRYQYDKFDRYKQAGSSGKFGSKDGSGVQSFRAKKE